MSKLSSLKPYETQRAYSKRRRSWAQSRFNERTSNERQRSYSLLLREDFRNLIVPNYEKYFIIDSSDYSGIPNIVGCFFHDNKWIAYETDDRSHVILESPYDDPAAAYRDAAARKGLLFYPSLASSIALNGPVTVHDYNVLSSAVSSAINCLEKIANASFGIPSYAQIVDDIAFLKRIAEYL